MKSTARPKFLLNKLLCFFFFLKILNCRSVFRLLSFSVQRYLFRKKIPGVAIIALTYKCLCNCVHCSAGLYETYSQELSKEEWVGVIDQLDRLGVPRLHISGGEPALKNGFVEITQYACRKGIIVFFETNGYSISEGQLRQLKKAGVASVDVSIDSADENVHDSLRRLKGSFENALKTISLCRKIGLTHMVSTYATKENIYSGELIRLIMFSRGIKACAVRVLPAQPSGRWLDKPEVSLSRKDTQYLRSRFPVYTILDRTSLSICPLKSKYTIFVSPDGELHPCPHLPFSFGNIRNSSIDEAFDKMSTHPMFRDRAVCHLHDSGFRRAFIKPALRAKRKLPIRV
jgi:MoaA/NifB/PqqE/SkfB family radical SAM enzyme